MECSQALFHGKAARFKVETVQKSTELDSSVLIVSLKCLRPAVAVQYWSLSMSMQVEAYNTHRKSS